MGCRVSDRHVFPILIEELPDGPEADGWAVDREELPYGMGSVGVVLFTNDGGLVWKTQLANTLPGLNQVFNSSLW